MVVVWAFAETMLFSTLARVTHIGLNMAMTGHYSLPTFEARANFFIAIMQDWKTREFDKDQIAATIKKLKNLARIRNHWVHGDWCADAGKTRTIIFDQRAPIDSKNRGKPVKAADVVNHCAAVKQRAEMLGVLIRWTLLKA
jgi:hypothetical protein